MKIKNIRGSILVVTVGFALVFTMLGLGSIQMSGLQNEVAEKRKASAKALWLADGALDRARNKLPGGLLNCDSTNVADAAKCPSINQDNSQNYNVATVTCGSLTALTIPKLQDVPYCICGGTQAAPIACSQRWYVTTHGNVTIQNPQGGSTTTQSRGITAVVSKFNVSSNAVTTNGCVNNCTGVAGGSADVNPIQQNAGFSFDSIFGKSVAQMEALATSTYTDKTDPGGGYSGVTLITVAKNKSISPKGSLGSGFLIIDCSQNDPGTDCVSKINANTTFNGVIWIRGDVGTLNGTPNITGTMFVEASPSNDIKLNGNYGVTFDESAIYSAIGSLGSIPAKPTVIAWSEI